MNSKGEVKKCRVPLVREDEQRAWLERKCLDVALFETLEIEQAMPLRFRKKKEDRVGKIQPVKYQGILTVKDPDALNALIQTGIGPAKAFGCGLMLVRRA